MGKGGFAQVLLAENKQTKKDVAIKILKKDKMSLSDLELYRHEIEAMRLSQHPNIIQCYDVLEDAKHLYLTMEYLKGGDLVDYLNDCKYRISEQRAGKITLSIVKALVYMHKIGIVHRDIKPENVMLADKSPDSDVKIVDFGLAVLLGNKEKCSMKVGTLAYTAPEILIGLPYDKAVDYWGLGMITYFLLSGKLPFDLKLKNMEMKEYFIGKNKLK